MRYIIHQNGVYNYEKIIRMPIKRINTLNTRKNTNSFNLPFTQTPNLAPSHAPGTSASVYIHATLPCWICPIDPATADSKTRNMDVATPNDAGKLNTTSINGTMSAPPPIPNNPDKIPTTKENVMAIGILI